MYIITLLLSIFRIPNISYSTKSRRLAVGGRAGQVVVYDLKQGRTQTVHAHKHPVTTLVFSDDGKLLATYSYADSLLSIWQVINEQVMLPTRTVQNQPKAILDSL